jgi:2-hydroxy-3-keto-5-methylthiopentenyl-1-phosphate phosphatase
MNKAVTFSKSIEKLAAVKVQAENVSAAVETQKQEIKTNVATMFAEIKMLIEESMQLIAEAPKGKEGTSALLAMKGELDAVEVVLTEGNNLLAQDQLQASLGKATVAKDKALQLNTELKEIMSKYKSAKI